MTVSKIKIFIILGILTVFTGLKLFYKLDISKIKFITVFGNLLQHYTHLRTHKSPKLYIIFWQNRYMWVLWFDSTWSLLPQIWSWRNAGPVHAQCGSARRTETIHTHTCREGPGTSGIYEPHRWRTGLIFMWTTWVMGFIRTWKSPIYINKIWHCTWLLFEKRVT